MLKAEFKTRKRLRSSEIAKMAGQHRSYHASNASCRPGPLTRRVLGRDPCRLRARGLQMDFALPRANDNVIQDNSGLFRGTGEYAGFRPGVRKFRRPKNEPAIQQKRSKLIALNRTKSDLVGVNRTILKHFFMQNQWTCQQRGGRARSNRRDRSNFNAKPHKHFTMNELRHNLGLGRSKPVKVSQSDLISF